MFWNDAKRQKKMLAKQKKKEAYDRVLQLHKQAEFLFYIDDAYLEEYEGNQCVKLEGAIASGEGLVKERYSLYDCEGRLKAEVEIDEFYVGAESVEKLVADDKNVVIYPKHQKVVYRAGDILCKQKKVMEEQ